MFGSLCYKHVPDQNRKKLDDKGKSMILLGYHSIGAYILFDPSTKNVAVSGDVMFDESKSWD